MEHGVILECATCGMRAETETALYAEELVRVHEWMNPSHWVTFTPIGRMA